jgi:amino acid adenylation domain-containing protein
LAEALSGDSEAARRWQLHAEAAGHADPPDRAALRPGLAHRETPLSGSITLAATTDVAGAIGSLYADIERQEQVRIGVEEPGRVPAEVLVTRDGTTIAAPTATPDARLGLLLTDADPEDYLPVLAPPYPVTVLGFRGHDGSIRIRTWTDAAIPPGVGELITSQLPRRSRSGPMFHLEPEEVAQIRRSGRGAHLRANESATVNAAFLSVARTDPERVAVGDDEYELSYGSLDRLSRTAASELVRRGVTVGMRVGVCMERTPLAIVALLAVLRAGACYVPLDPTHPEARRSYIAEDAGLRLVVTDDGAAGLPGVASVAVGDLLNGKSDHPLPEAGPDHAAYMIYTSGTTGSPKGVVVPHRNVLALIAATRQRFDLLPSDVWTLFHSLAFDFSVWEIWGCLLTGGRLVVVPYWTARTPARFAGLLRDRGVTVLSQTPSAFAGLVPVATAGPLPLDVRLVVFGGEALRRSTLTEWIKRFPLADCRLVNIYGITETTVHVTWHDVTAAEVVTDSRTVGRALPGWSVTVRSPEGRILPYHVPGEICVGGAGLATGYHARPELTTERFPIDSATGERYYRSGDLGRMLPDGTLDHLGRMDDQVKIRGYRIELGEVRAALLKDPDVRDSVVALREDIDGGVIHAYLVTDRPISTADMRRRLGDRLPDHMIPAALHVVAEIPLTVNGKADLAKLAAATDRPGPDPAAPVADAPEAGSAIRRVWEETFGPASADEDFFDLGGSSLQALRISTALTGLFPSGLEPRDVYLHPGVKNLIALVESRGE